MTFEKIARLISQGVFNYYSKHVKVLVEQPHGKYSYKATLIVRGDELNFIESRDYKNEENNGNQMRDALIREVDALKAEGYQVK